jgi:hypothetical protein
MKTTRAGSEELRRYEPVSDVVILVALDRAERHVPPNPWRETGVYWPRLVEHLGFVSGSWTTRRLRPQVDGLIDAGLIVKTSNAGRVRWGLTETGAMRVAQARIDGDGTLPASPQRRHWQRARREAEVQIEDVRERLGSELRDALKLFEDGGGDSASWYGVGQRLAHDCAQFAAATFCLQEWDELDEEHPDLDLGSMTNTRVREAVLALSRMTPTRL